MGIYKLLSKKKKKSGKKQEGVLLSDEESLALKQADLRLKMIQKKVKKLVKQQKLRMVGSILKQANSDEPWGPAIQVKVQGTTFSSFGLRFKEVYKYWAAHVSCQA